MKNGKKEIYFAHPFDKIGTKREAIIIEKLKELGYEVTDPFKGEDFLCEKYECDNYYGNPCRAFAEDIMKRDLSQIDRCEALFVWIPKGVTTIGIIREVDYAFRHNKYVIIMTYKANPWLLETDELYLSYRDFLEGKKYGWEDKRDGKTNKPS